jgi:glycosyltransferase involved in cell wall biosynthesis
MRVLFLSFPYESAPGGGERYAERTVEGLRAAGRRATLVSSSRALLGLFLARGWSAYPLWGGIEPVSKVAAAVFPLTAPFFLPLLALVLAWARFAAGARTLVCLSLTDKLLATGVARLLGMRVIWMEHLVAGRSLLMNPFRWLYAALSRLATVVTVSEAAADSLAAAGVVRSRIRIVPPGAAPIGTPPGPAAAPVVGAISRLSKEKNVALLLRAFALVAREIPEAELRVYGDGPERAALEALAASLGIAAKVAFLGHVPDAGARCGEFAVFAVPSSRESFGLAVLEAMACGVPVVATAVGGLPELILDGETGKLVAPEDERAMAGALLELLRDREAALRMGAAGRARAATRFSLSKMQSAWVELTSPR